METIYQKLGAVMKNVSAVKKAQKNQSQNFMFRGIDDMMNALHNEFAKEGIILIPKELEHIQDSYEYSADTTDRQGNKVHQTKVQFRSRVHMAFTFTSCEDGSSVTADGWGEAADNGDKGYNKCKSIALKYVLMQMFLVPTMDIADPDKETPDDLDKAKKTDDTLHIALAEVRGSLTVESLEQVWRNYAILQSNDNFKREVSKRKNELL